MVDVVGRGWRDNSGIFSKATVEERILHVLNERLGCNKTYNNYQSRLKWFKNHWLSYSNLMRFSSGFGYNHTMKKFTASDEVCDAYLEAHSNDTNLRYGECPDYEDLKITVENGVAVGKNSIGLGSATDAKTLGDDENRDARIEDLNFDAENEMFVALSEDEPPSSGSIPPPGFPEVSEVSTQRRTQPKRSRAQYETLNTIAPDMMVKPSIGIPAKIQESTRFNPFFKDCIGAIDGTHIPATFMYVLSGWEGSAHDSKLLNDGLSRRNELHVPQGKYFLVDCGFAKCKFLTPLRGIRYHLKDFGGQVCHPRNVSELFNLRHASLRNVIERIFGVFKSRFKIFKTAPPFLFQTEAELILACAGLHNFLWKECRSDEFPVEYEEDQDSPHLDMEEGNLE
ncbi:nuclease HARBI1-like protein [Perilla frutescens var. hirtella]|uniref:Nuclease HARBI1-like protein n=1 Tax=Perilla frutescens var. hirtella TaxID=608512 RepID=A0AAD4P8B1_PERFH|nr:nuclease HARBI1-like protein [Perilla frutescens var. hirtella]